MVLVNNVLKLTPDTCFLGSGLQLPLHVACANEGPDDSGLSLTKEDKDSLPCVV